MSENKINRNSSTGEQFVEEPPKWLYQNVLYPIHSISDRASGHASQMIVGPLKNEIQSVYVVWFCGTGEGNLDVGIMLSEITYKPEEVLKNYSKEMQFILDDPFESNKNPYFNYSTPQLIADDSNRACGNPVLHIDKKNRAHLWYAAFYTKGSVVPDGEDPHRRDIFYKYSDDNMQTWSDPVIWSDRPGLWVRFSLLDLDDGTWILPINDEETYLPEYDCKWSCRFAFSYDEGKTWELDNKLYSIDKLEGDTRGGIIQPTVVQLDDGSLYCMNRSHTRHIVEMRSTDRGQTWTKPVNSGLPNPQCGVCLCKRDKDGKKDELLLIYNPSISGRDPISIAQSKDNGNTWKCLFDLRHELGELSYPCIVQTPDGLVHCTYTLHRMTISHDVFKLQK